MPNSVADGKTLPRLSMQVIKKKVLEITRIRPQPPRKVSVERKYFTDSGPGGGYYDYNDAEGTVIKVTGEQRVTADEVSTVTVAAISGDQDVRLVRIQYSPIGSTDPIPFGYEHPGKVAGGIHILKIYKSGGNLMVDIYNNGSVDVDARVFYSSEAST